MEKQQLLGAHMSITQGFAKAVTDGQSIGCTAIQIFTHSNRQWHMKPLEQDAIDRFKKAQIPSTIKSVMVHASYLINIGSSNHELRAKSVKALIEELHRCEQLGIPLLVLHPGSAGDESEEKCMALIAQGLDEVIMANPGHSMVLLENSAGQGSVVGYTFEQLATIRKLSHHKARIGFCFDTCHAFAAGYDLSNKITYKETWNHFDKVLGLEHLKAIHVNDSKKALGSRVDRHDDIGQGLMGIESFSLLINDPRFSNIPKILETPSNSILDYKRNLDLLKSLER
jgi:deoxyribonuclease-4